ncbi:MAG: hypothetical protein KatS3mg121_1519 [Gammaproteobacteria bacterium]|nr:MAG: hypothetical protein KatS3mg121_1519 [Gammaproteobacteria bacterium]
MDARQLIRPARRSGRAARGFTLLELLVVVVIIAVIVAAAGLSLRDGGRDRLREEARRLAVLLELAQEEAVLQSRQLGLGVWEDGYGFYVFSGMVDENGRPIWTPLEDPQLRRRAFPEGLRVELYLEGRPVVLDALPVERPQIMLLSSGESTPFELELGDGEFRVRLRGDGLGGVTREEAPVGEPWPEPEAPS